MENKLEVIGTQKEKFWTRFGNWLKTPKGKVIFILLIIFLGIICTAGYYAYARYIKKEITNTNNNSNQNLPNVDYKKEPEVKKAISLLDGQLYPEDIANRHPLAIMIENHPDARPQSGLDKAKIVYEAITEGGITRFMALFGPESPEKAGPVRSARSYFIDWCLEYDCFYAHVGGSSDALAKIDNLGVKDLSQFSIGTAAFWREPNDNIAIEHTMYTDANKLYSIAQDNGWDMKGIFDSWKFKNDTPLDQRGQASIATIDFSSADFLVKWTYDRESNSYKREMGGIAHNDAITGKQLAAKNVIIQEVERWYQPDSESGKEGWQMQTTGEGKAKILTGGKVYEATWKKSNQNSRTKYYASDGTEIELNPGNTWVEIVPPDRNVTIE